MSLKKAFHSKMSLYLVLSLSAVLTLTGCGGNTSKRTDAGEKPQAGETAIQTEKMTEAATEALAPQTEAATEALASQTEAATEALTPHTEAVTEVISAQTESAAEAMSSPFTIFLDEEIYTEPSVSPDSEDPVRVYITYNGYPLLDLPFGEEHTVLIHQINGAENTVRMTGEAVYMESATCDNQDCVNMGQVTRENLETRVLGGFIVCLPNMLVVEVRGE